MKWLSNNRLLILILSSAVLIGSFGNMLLGALSFGNLQWYDYILFFLNSLIVQAIILIVLLWLSTKWPKIGGVLLIIVFSVLALAFLPSYYHSYHDSPSIFSTHPEVLVLYLSVILLYSVSGIILFRNRKI